MKPKVKNTKARQARKAQGHKDLKSLKAAVDSFDESVPVSKFEELPLSSPTQKGLRESYFVDLTPIQKQAIIACIKGNDLLGAAKTGSGKTLAFLVPVLERLYRERWSQTDGLGALVITPTRELALQIFEVLRKVGRFHQFSAGLLVGGKDVRQEKSRVGKLNILVCTPGRLLQHMDESPDFDALNLQMLVLDEADRILDMGFKATIDAIVQNLSPERQTLLFSATQTKSVGDLARLSLVNPKYVSVDAENPSATPKDLEQYYTICSLDQKLDLLWSFLRSHTKSKILVFLSSSKQVRFTFEAFRRLRPGIPLLHLHGRQKQMARIEATKNFSHSRASCLIATDVVARGIDFPEVDWVIQLDCPEDTATYIHRVGRSARAGKSGRALLFLTPTEQPFVEKLTGRKVPIQKLDIRDAKKSSIQPELQAQNFQDPELKYLAQKAFISYVRSIHIQKDKEVFDVKSLQLEEFAKSLGLASAPDVKIRGEAIRNPLKNQPHALAEPPKAKDGKVRTKYDRMFERQNQDVLSEHYKKLSNNDEQDEEDDFIKIRRSGHDIDEDSTPQLLNVPESKRAQKRALSKKAIAQANGTSHTKLVFDDEGEAHPIYEFQNEADFKAAGDAEEQRKGFLETETVEMAERDSSDKLLAKEKREEKKRRRKELERLAEEYSESEDENVVRLPSAGEESDYSEEPEQEAPRKKHKKDKKPMVIEVEQPQSLADLEALSASLLRG